jgi:hypothetical protein
MSLLFSSNDVAQSMLQQRTFVRERSFAKNARRASQTAADSVQGCGATSTSARSENESLRSCDPLFG